MFIFIDVFRQIMIFIICIVLSFGITKFINVFLKPKKYLCLVLPLLLFIMSVTFLILGLISTQFRELSFIEYSILSFFGLVGSVIATLGYIFNPRK